MFTSMIDVPAEGAPSRHNAGNHDQIKVSRWAHPGSLDPLLRTQAGKPAGVTVSTAGGVRLTLGRAGETSTGMPSPWSVNSM